MPGLPVVGPLQDHAGGGQNFPLSDKKELVFHYKLWTNLFVQWYNMFYFEFNLSKSKILILFASTHYSGFFDKSRDRKTS